MLKNYRTVPDDGRHLDERSSLEGFRHLREYTLGQPRDLLSNSYNNASGLDVRDLLAKFKTPLASKQVANKKKTEQSILFLKILKNISK